MNIDAEVYGAYITGILARFTAAACLVLSPLSGCQPPPLHSMIASLGAFLSGRRTPACRRRSVQRAW